MKNIIIITKFFFIYLTPRKPKLDYKSEQTLAYERGSRYGVSGD